MLTGGVLLLSFFKNLRRSPIRDGALPISSVVF